ncbi:hypothetical protein I6I92_00195 [Peptoniphilus asaccharolyticus]|nr:hypothetical protein [Peptoniphilus asaccharolyticus]
MDLASILQGVIYLLCLGAVLDLALCISSAIDEIEYNQILISNKSPFK